MGIACKPMGKMKAAFQRIEMQEERERKAMRKLFSRKKGK